MSAFNIDAALRWFRFDRGQRLKRRPDRELPFLTDPIGSGSDLLLDTCVYIDQFRGLLPSLASQLLEMRHVNHSTVAIQELMFGLGLLDPADRRTPGAARALRTTIQAMQPHRTFVPDPDISARAALMAGLLSRVQDYTGDARKRALMDATIFLQAQKLGLVVLTANIGDFDLMLQLIPSGRAAFYRRDQ